jgi:hypothetical protein
MENNMQNLGYSSIFWGNAFAFQRKELKYKSHHPKTVVSVEEEDK